jgi:hypothetical protein
VLESPFAQLLGDATPPASVKNVGSTFAETFGDKYDVVE